MTKFKLLSNEIDMIINLKNSRIPEIFKSDYLDHLLTVENIHFYLTEDLLSRKTIKYDLTEEFKDLQKTITLEKLDENAKHYYSNLVSVFEIYKKYYGSSIN